MYSMRVFLFSRWHIEVVPITAQCNIRQGAVTSHGKHFLDTFLAPYGSVYGPQDDVDLIHQLRPYICKWFKGTNVAMSELSHTVHDNLPLLNRYSGNVFKEDMVRTLQDMNNPMMDSLARLNKDNVKDRAMKRDVLEIMRTVLEEDEDLDETIDDLFKAAAAMYLAVQPWVVRALFRNPELFAQKCETIDGSHLSFQNVVSIREMQLFLTNTIVRSGSQVPRQRAQNLANLLHEQHTRQAPRWATQRRHVPTRAGCRHMFPTLQEEKEEEIEDVSRAQPLPPRYQYIPWNSRHDYAKS